MKCPQYFFTLKSLVIKSGIESLNIEGKNYKAFNSLTDKIEDDHIESTYITPANTFMAVVTSGGYSYCYRLPNYDLKWTIDIKLSNDQIARIMKVFRNRNMAFDIETSCNTFDRNWVCGCAVTSRADILAVAFVDGYINMIDTATRDLLHIIHAHVDMVSNILITKNDVMLTGGIDSNIKVWKNFRTPNLSPDYVFLKHTDKINSIRSFTIGDNEYVLSSDEEGMIYYWQVGSYRAEKFLSTDENSLVDGNDQIVFALSIEDSSLVLKKFSFTKKTPIGRVIIRYFDELEEYGIRSLLGYNESDIFAPKRSITLSSEVLLQSRQERHHHLAAKHRHRVLPCRQNDQTLRGQAFIHSKLHPSLESPCRPGFVS